MLTLPAGLQNLGSPGQRFDQVQEVRNSLVLRQVIALGVDHLHVGAGGNDAEQPHFAIGPPWSRLDANAIMP